MKTASDFAQNVEGYTKLHLSLTGTRAGMIICGLPELPPGEKSFHAAYAPNECFSNPLMCPECLALWNDCE